MPITKYLANKFDDVDVLEGKGLTKIQIFTYNTLQEINQKFNDNFYPDHACDLNYLFYLLDVCVFGETVRFRNFLK